MASLLFGGKRAFQSLLYPEDGLRSDYMQSLTVFFSAAASQTQMGFGGIISPPTPQSVQTNMAKGQHWACLDMLPILCGLNPTKNTQSCTEAWNPAAPVCNQPVSVVVLLLLYRSFMETKSTDSTGRHFIRELLPRDSPAPLMRWDVHSDAMTALRKVTF